MAFRVGEVGDRRAVRDFHRAEDPLSAQGLGLLEGRFDVFDAHVEHRVAVPVALRRRADAACHVAAADVGHPVVHRVVGVDLPAEELAEEALQGLRVATCDLEVDQWTAHVFSSYLSLGSGPASPPAAAIERRPRYMSHPSACAATDWAL